jgi:hypothetical protein
MKYNKAFSLTAIIAIIIAILVVGGMFYYKKGSSEITVEDAYKFCNQLSCPKNEVTLGGELMSDGYNFFTLDGQDKTVYITIDEKIPLLARIKLRERLYTIQNGRVQAKVKGLLSYDTGAFCDMGGCQEVVRLKAKDADSFTFLNKIGCGRTPDSFPSSDCFSLSIGGRSVSEAYSILVSSDLYNKNKYNLTGHIEYDTYNDDAYNFQAGPYNSGEDGGCSSYYNVYIDKIIFKKNCVDDNIPDLNLEQKI